MKRLSTNIMKSIRQQSNIIIKHSTNRKLLNQRVIFRKYLHPLFLGTHKSGLLFLLLFINSCKDSTKATYVVFQNYGTHGDASIGYAKLILPIPFEKTHSKYNDFDYSVKKYVKGAELITASDTINLMYSPLNLRTRFYSLIRTENSASFYTPYILLFNEPFKWSSLYQMDSLFQVLYNDLQEIRYLDTNNNFHSIKNLKFEFLYYFDGKQVKKNSSEFKQKMKIELPPPVKSSDSL